jgi:transcriptional regulator with XRE-family HTH domain
MSKQPEQPVVAAAPPEQRIGKPEASSGRRGRPFDSLLARLEAQYPGIEEEIGSSSAALRAGRQVREMRLAKGWTQMQLAEVLGWDQVRISNIERGQGPLGPTFDVLQKVAAACDYEIEFKQRQKEQPRPEKKPLGYAYVLQRMAELFAHPDPLPATMVLSPQFAAACTAFTDSLGSKVPTYVRAVEGAPANEIIAEGEIIGISGISYVEMKTRGKRMVMLPVLVEDSDVQADTGADLAMTLIYPHS